MRRDLRVPRYPLARVSGGIVSRSDIVKISTAVAAENAIDIGKATR